MPTYDYECTACRKRFELRQAMADAPVELCPTCGGPARRVVSAGTSVVLKKGPPAGHGRSKGGCALETSGTTCCGRSERCGASHCGSED